MESRGVGWPASSNPGKLCTARLAGTWEFAVCTENINNQINPESTVLSAVYRGFASYRLYICNSHYNPFSYTGLGMIVLRKEGVLAGL